MRQITCFKCRQTKDIESYAWANKSLNKRQKVCRDCKADYHKKWYPKYKKRIGRKELRKRQRVKIQRARKWVYKYLLTHHCENCGESNPVVLEFDHTRKTEKYDRNSRIHRLIQRGYSIKRLQVEIKKCQVLCANCHRIKTAEDQGWYKLQ